jgi:hypothetical protein
MNNNNISSGGLFGDGSCFASMSRTSHSSYVPSTGHELDDAIAALGEKVATEAKAAETAQRLEAVREVLSERLEEILTDEIVVQFSPCGQATVRHYRADFRRFKQWCETVGLPYLPAAPETVAPYFCELADAGFSVSKLNRIRSSIARVHELASHLPTRHALDRASD